MPEPLSSSPSQEYRQREQAREATAARWDKAHRSIGNLRLVLVLATLVVAWFSLHRHQFSVWWLLAPIAAFIAAVLRHHQILERRSLAQRAAHLYRQGLARIEDRWATPDPGSSPNSAPAPPQTPLAAEAAASLYAADLDLFGPASLFELLSRARTCMGEDALARWLLAPAPIPEILARQTAIAELRPRLDLREDIALLGPPTHALRTGVHPRALLEWAAAPAHLDHPTLRPSILRWLAPLLAVLTLAGAVLWYRSGISSLCLLSLIAEGAIFFTLKDPLKKIFSGAERALADLKLLSALLARIESESTRQPFTSPRLRLIARQLSSHAIPGSRAIARLQTIGDLIDSSHNWFVQLLDVPLLYSLQVALAAESWRRAHAAAVPAWLTALGDLEALLSLATYSYEHPADPFPQLLDDFHTPASFHAEDLGHPLIPAAHCVRNTVTICNETRALLISGSNMSGKSTLLRSVGINTVLAMAGAPVRAQSLQLTPLHLGASILVSDSLQQGASRFYAEITRLRNICDLAAHHPPTLFLLDELLQGTNSKDRLIGAEAVLRELLESNAIGILTTHDLALTHLESSHPGLHNMHLQDQIADGKMTFDFQLREGVVTKSNGIELMRLIGLKV